MNILINYANHKFENARKWNSRSARFFGTFDKIYEFRPQDIDEKFHEEHKDLLSIERGNGVWLWKSYFINKVINDSQDGDRIFYLDSGAFFIRNPRILFDYISEDNPIFVTDIPLIESCWTKPECFDILDAHEYKDFNQIQSGYIIFLVNEYTRKFFKTYFEYCKNTKMLVPAGLGKYDEITRYYGNQFVSHREDQSILSLLCHKNGIKAHRDISQRGFTPESFYNPNYAYRIPEHPDDKYPSIIYLHKSPSITKFVLTKLYLKLKLNKIKNIIRK